MLLRSILYDSTKLLIIFIFFFFNSNFFSQNADEAKLKNVLAVYIYNFTKFIEWSGDNSKEFHICVLGESNIVDPLKSIAAKEKVNGKNIIVDELTIFDKLDNCDILFAPIDDENKLSNLLKKTEGNSLLLITNTEGFAEKGAGINFLRSGDKIKFEINKRALEENGIIPSSRLLSIAVKVYE